MITKIRDLFYLQDHRGRSQPIAIDVLFDSWLMAVSPTNKEDEATQMALAMEQGS